MAAWENDSGKRLKLGKGDFSHPLSLLQYCLERILSDALEKHDGKVSRTITRPGGYKTFFVLNSTEHDFFLLINVKMPTIVRIIVGILTFMSRKNSILGLSEPNISQIS